MIDENGNYKIQGIATPRGNGGHIVALDAADICDWLRAPHPFLSDEERDLLDEIADQVDVWAMQILDNELASRNQE